MLAQPLTLTLRLTSLTFICLVGCSSPTQLEHRNQTLREGQQRSGGIPGSLSLLGTA